METKSGEQGYSLSMGKCLRERAQAMPLGLDNFGRIRRSKLRHHTSFFARASFARASQESA